MSGFTSITIMGNVGRDPETKQIGQKGTTCTSFSVAVSEKRDAPPTWFRCQAFGKVAEIIAQHVHKGSQVLVSGKIECRKYQKDGQEKESWDVTVDRFAFAGSKPDGESAPRDTGGARQNRTGGGQQGGFDDGQHDGPMTGGGRGGPADDEEIPFNHDQHGRAPFTE